jgi:predicted component of type VI protein secretion system
LITLFQLRKPKKPKIPKNATRDRQYSKQVTLLHTLEPANLLGIEYPIEGEMFIGRAEECIITVSDSFASHLHARIFLQDNSQYLEDLTSTNGTFVNGEKIESPQILKCHDRIQIGDTVLEAK